MSGYDVIVVGAGLAGLRCATRLAEAGRDVVVLEANDTVGGRERTDVVDGFRLDLGFHVLNPAYPAVRRWVDVDALALRRFPVAVGVRLDDRLARLAHPLRHPSSVPETLRSGLVRPADLAALTRWAGPTVASARLAKSGTDHTLDEAWDRSVRLDDGRYIAGDHRDTASIQGALVSGQRAAEAVLADLAR